MTLLRWIWSIAIIAVIGSSVAGIKENGAALNGESYIKEIISEYGFFTSYKDTGKIEVVYYEDGQKVDEKQKEFSTNYIKNGPFEIQWKKLKKIGHGLKYRIWTSEGDTYSKYGFDDEFRSESLGDALSRAAGISTLLTTYVPCLLHKEAGCFLCDQRLGYTVSSVVQEDDGLLRLDILDRSGNIESVWIDNNTKTLKRIEWWTERGNLRVHHRITYSTVQAEK